MANSSSVRIGNDYKEFDNNFNKNIIKAGGETTSAVERASDLVQYFKSKNESYLDLVKLAVEESKNV